MGRYIFYVVACLAVGSIARADTVLLANGHRIENVVVESAADGVTIRFSYGEMKLPAGMVAGVEKSESSLERYLAATAALAAERGTTAAAWFELAFAARADGLDDGYRRALLRAAALEPHWPPLAAPMRALDYVLDETRGRWLPYEETAMAIAQAAERETARRIAVAGEAARARTAQRERLVETLEVALLARVVEELTERNREPARRPGIGLGGPYATTVIYPGYGAVFASGHGRHDTEEDRAIRRELTRRQPGSLLPLTPGRQPAPRSNHSSFKSPDGD